ncbi:MAG: site-specific integrase [Actinobacteria bacterium]|nr:site-specific integrase [Actinomycetota bacterium]
MGASGRSKTSLAEFLRAEWLPAIKTTVRATTFANYESHIERHLVPHLGDLRLGELDGRTLNGFYAVLLAHGRTDGKGGLAPSSVRRIHAALHKALKDAVRWGFLTENPADAADPPKLRAEGPNEMTTWTAEQLRAFLAFAITDPLYPLWFLLASTGMRRGEALGLRWCDVDLDAGQVSVRRSVVSVNGSAQLSTPKTSRSRRVIAIDHRTVAVLAELRSRACASDPSQPIFEGCFNSSLDPVVTTRRFKELVAASGLPRIRLHDLRHTHATLALQAGVHPKIVSERLGHSTVSMTLDVYSHAVPHMQRDAADQIARVVWDD